MKRFIPRARPDGNQKARSRQRRLEGRTKEGVLYQRATRVADLANKLATRERGKLEREAQAADEALRGKRLEEGQAVKLFKSLPTVEDLAANFRKQL